MRLSAHVDPGIESLSTDTAAQALTQLGERSEKIDYDGWRRNVLDNVDLNEGIRAWWEASRYGNRPVVVQELLREVPPSHRHGGAASHIAVDEESAVLCQGAELRHDVLAWSNKSEAPRLGGRCSARTPCSYKQT
jgi:hypothetical protein